jgi:hypothetical protein
MRGGAAIMKWPWDKLPWWQERTIRTNSDKLVDGCESTSTTSDSTADSIESIKPCGRSLIVGRLESYINDPRIYNASDKDIEDDDDDDEEDDYDDNSTFVLKSAQDIVYSDDNESCYTEYYDSMEASTAVPAFLHEPRHAFNLTAD